MAGAAAVPLKVTPKSALHAAVAAALRASFLLDAVGRRTTLHYY